MNYYKNNQFQNKHKSTAILIAARRAAGKYIYEYIVITLSLNLK